MNRICLSGNDWTLLGLLENTSKLGKSKELGEDLQPAVPKQPAQVPGAVQLDLLRNNVLEDVNVGLNSRNAEWTEHLEWVYSKQITVPETMKDKRIFLEFDGLDYSGSVYIDGREVGQFEGTHIPHSFDITEFVVFGTEQVLSVLFNPVPDLPGQIGYTYKIKIYKPRFNYTWDWVSRTVSCGIWDHVWLCAYDDVKIDGISVCTGLQPDFKTGKITVILELDKEIQLVEGYKLKWSLEDKENAEVLSEGIISLPDKESTSEFTVQNVKPWYPNNMGAQPLYRLKLQIVTNSEAVLDERVFQVGFKHVEWIQNEHAPENARPSLLKINGQEVFLRGANWVPLSSYFGGVSRDKYRATLLQYKRMNVNILRVWGGGILEKTDFYDLCDELGILVWQEFPLSSSGLSDYPPFEEETISLLSKIAASMVRRRCHHVSHILWSGGNELAKGFDGGMEGRDIPIDLDHPLIAEFNRIVSQFDPNKKFIPTSGHGPRAFANAKDYGKGLHHDVHGPWAYLGPKNHYEYYNKDDSLWRSEVGVPGYTNMRLMEENSGSLAPWPAAPTNQLWLHHGAWWVRPELMERVFGSWCETCDSELPIHLKLSRYLQLEGYRAVVEACRRRALECSLVTIWMGHDCFWTTANNSVIEYDGSLKPAYSSIQRAYASVKVSVKYDKLWAEPGERVQFEVFVLKDRPVKLEEETVKVRCRDITGEIIKEEQYIAANLSDDGGFVGRFEITAEEFPNRLFFIDVSISVDGTEYRDVYMFGQQEKHVFAGLRNLEKTTLVVSDVEVYQAGSERAIAVEVENIGDFASVMTEVVPSSSHRRISSEGNAVILFPGEKSKVVIYGLEEGTDLQVEAINADEVKVNL